VTVRAHHLLNQLGGALGDMPIGTGPSTVPQVSRSSHRSC
jgi:hypothetical protein